METFKIKNLSFVYPGERVMALDDVSFSVNCGEFVCICGKSGCGKTTLLRLLKPSISPHGQLDGEIVFMDQPLSDIAKRKEVSEIGFVMQNPENSIVTDKVWHELAFGLESLGVSNTEIQRRVAEMTSFFGINDWFHKSVAELSGGQKQILNLASVMVMQPKVIILDEPTSQLDPIAAEEFVRILRKINIEMGTTVIISEHRLEDVFSISDRVIVMENGRIIADGSPQYVSGILKEKEDDMCMALPTPVRVYGAVENGAECPLTVRDGRRWFENYAAKYELKTELIPQCENRPPSSSVIEIKDAWFRYEKNLPDVIKGLNLKIQKGELFAIVGGNGAGKTTLISLISGLNHPYRGKVFINNEEISKIKNLYGGVLGVLPQNPQSLFVKSTVYSDLAEMLTDKRMTDAEKKHELGKVCKLCCIESLLMRHPYDLSGGEQQRVALAKVLLTKPQILILDEPTKGFDAHFKQQFAEILDNLKESGITIVMVSHDIEFCARYADRCAMLFDGNVTAVGNAREFFVGNSFYTTSANRMGRQIIPNAVTAEDIILYCGGNEPQQKKTDFFDTPAEPIKEKPQPELKPDASLQKSKGNRSKQTIFSILTVIFLIPLTVLTGDFLFDSKKYYFISLLIICEVMLTFVFSFEKRKVQARELVIISVLCAIAVAGRCAFAFLPQFKPVVALIIISGMCFGGETGFLVGTVTGFVSNFYFGQGPWTPWHMFAFGVIGFLSGALFNKKRIGKVRLCIFGGLVTQIVYGVIMNLSSVITVFDKPNLKTVMSALAAGFPMDLIHGISTMVFLWFLAEPMREKLERVKEKYGLGM